MATSPPLEEKVNLYLIVTLPFSPGSFHHFFIYSASILADSEMQNSFKLYLITSFFLLEIQLNMGIQETVSMYLHSRKMCSWGVSFKTQSYICPFHYGFKCSHEISIPWRVSFSLHPNLYSRVSLCHTIPLTIFPRADSNTSSQNFNCNSSPHSNTTLNINSTHKQTLKM